MPNNQLLGMLEHFCSFLIQLNDTLWQMTEQTLQEVVRHDPRFPETQTIKAQLHIWLAWQKEPGKSIGKAITKRYFDHKADHAKLFCSGFVGFSTSQYKHNHIFTSATTTLASQHEQLFINLSPLFTNCVFFLVKMNDFSFMIGQYVSREVRGLLSSGHCRATLQQKITTFLDAARRCIWKSSLFINRIE